MIQAPNLSRRVSFDLSHNIVYVLPTFEECRDAAKQKSREEWQRRSLNEDMLNEDIIAEIQEDCYSSSRDSDEEFEVPMLPTKSCLKKPPVLMQVNKKQKNTKKHQQKKRKRLSTQTSMNNMISVH